VDVPVGFEEFVRSESRVLLRTAWLLCGNWATAEDLVQTTLAATWPRWTSLRRKDAPEVYVRKVMLTTFLRWNRRRWTGELSTGTMPQRADLSDAYAGSDLRNSLVDALQSLPARQRAVITMRYFADLTERETAAALGCSVGAVKSHSSRALISLRRAPALADLIDEGAVE